MEDINIIINNINQNETVNINRNNRIDQMKKIQQDGLSLFSKKNIDYGDAFANYGVIGVLMRIEDKIQRSLTITKNNINLVNDESIRDTLLDLHNYAAMAIMLLDEEAKNEDCHLNNSTESLN